MPTTRAEHLDQAPVLTFVESILPKDHLTVTLGDLTVGADAAATLRGLADFTD
jgi:hypothetical protein